MPHEAAYKHRPQDSQVLALSNVAKLDCPVRSSFEPTRHLAMEISEELESVLSSDNQILSVELLASDLSNLLGMIRGLMEEYQHKVDEEKKVIHQFVGLCDAAAGIQCLLWSLAPKHSPEPVQALQLEKITKQIMEEVKGYLENFDQLAAA